MARNYRIPLRTEIAKALLGKVEACAILDLGCGNGEISAAFLENGNRVTMVDASAAMLSEARRLTLAEPVEYLHADLHAFDGRGFDVTLCLGVLSHVDSTDGVMAAIARSLRPGGRCIVQLSDSAAPTTRLFRALHALRRLARPRALIYRATALEDVIRAAQRHGLSPIAMQRHLLLLPGLARLLGEWLIPFDRFVRRQPWVAAMAMDALVLFEKTHDGRLGI